MSIVDRHASHAFRMTAFGEYADDDTASTMKHRDYKDVTDIVVEPRMVVRRLTPVECCRLQGFPDDYLDVIHKGKPFSNSAKYKALGNSMAVDVMRYIGESIVQALRPE